MLTGRIFDLQRMSIHDGPGIRTTVFLQGCPLRCQWCHNPEGWEPRTRLALTPSLCIGCRYCLQHCPNAAHRMEAAGHVLDREACTECLVCAEGCYSGALEAVGREAAPEDVLAEVEKDRPFYEESGGGMTLSGGEPLMQPAFAGALLRGARERGLHTCIETCGLAPRDVVESVVPHADLVLFDYKESDPERHRRWTGLSNEVILENLRLVDGLGVPMILRCPIIPGLNLREDHLRGIAGAARSLSHCVAVHVMGFHRLGESKRARLGLPATEMPPGSMSREEIEAVAALLHEYGAENVLAG